LRGLIEGICESKTASEKAPASIAPDAFGS
jgi:hypothetical protein